ncbi:MAG: 1,4-dihydroxy-6-naphthoate synthase [Geobacteraceae bacterium]|nr:1,4-dihydroxy-6-naphthoate synthase [Geobacteraceae bacterium]
MRTLSLGYSPCPNDTLMFYPLVHELVDTGALRFRERLEDVETLNTLAIENALDVCKVSYHAFAHIRQHYVLLRSGGAMGRGCGPVIVARQDCRIADLKEMRIATPGRYTTAHLLLRLFNPQIGRIIPMPFHEIMPAVIEGRVDAGVIIHESRFTFQDYGLKRILDLGEWWESKTGLPLPLGGIAAKRSLGDSLLHEVDKAVRASVEYATSHRGEASEYIRAHAREMDDGVCSSHIALYVNHHSLDPGTEGERAAEALISLAAGCGLVPDSSLPVYVSTRPPVPPADRRAF